MVTTPDATHFLAGYLELRSFPDSIDRDSELWGADNRGNWIHRIRLALVLHPSTPVPSADRIMVRGVSRGYSSSAGTWSRLYGDSVYPVARPLCTTRQEFLAGSLSYALHSALMGLTPMRTNTPLGNAWRSSINAENPVRQLEKLFELFASSDGEHHWSATPFMAFKMPNKGDTFERCYETGGVTPWPIVDRAKTRLAKLGIRI